MLVMISYDYLHHFGQVTKFNFTGHSTGGAIAVMFANRFPLNVGEVFAVDASLMGTSLEGIFELCPYSRMNKGDKI